MDLKRLSAAVEKKLEKPFKEKGTYKREEYTIEENARGDFDWEAVELAGTQNAYDKALKAVKAAIDEYWKKR